MTIKPKDKAADIVMRLQAQGLEYEYAIKEALHMVDNTLLIYKGVSTEQEEYWTEVKKEIYLL